MASGRDRFFPSKDEIRQFVADAPGKVGKREIARAFHLDASQRIHLKKVLKEMADEGALEKGHARKFVPPGTLPEVTVLQITGMDADGELLARPLAWDHEEAPPKVYMAPEKGRGHGPALGAGERVLARLRMISPQVYEARTIRRIAAAAERVLGVFIKVGTECRLRPTDRKAKSELMIPPNDTMDAEPGELVLCETITGRRHGLRQARVVERLGSRIGPKSASLLAIYGNEIPTEFPAEAVRQAEKAGPAPLDKRDDLRPIPLVTIDGEDARDFDDAVFAEADDDPKNPGGWHLIVAIADVAWYVRPGDALDREAYKRGNSVYFPDRVVPMLPEALSNGWCSLRPDEERPCMAAHMWINADGQLIRHKFVRGLMKSVARLTYTQVQRAIDGDPDDLTGPLVGPVLTPLYGAYRSLLINRAARGVLELDLPERKIVLNDDGSILRVETRERYDSHKLIEEFMIAANVAAAETLEKRQQPAMYRVHDLPTFEKLESLREFLDGLDLKLAKGQVIRPMHFNQILAKAAGTENAHMVNEIVLRTQSQANYSPNNIGHFGLALARYCHFTSPIRRYSDLLVHRALIRGLKLGEGGLEADHKDFNEQGEHISQTERRAAAAEREAVDRFTAAFLADKVGETFEGRINGVTRFGLFVTLRETGADGLVPISRLGTDFFTHDEKGHRLVGRRTGVEYRLGQDVMARISEADPVTGSLVFQLLDGDGETGGLGTTKGRPIRGRHGRNKDKGGNPAPTPGKTSKKLARKKRRP